jgi:hypothetical protein
MVSRRAINGFLAVVVPFETAAIAAVDNALLSGLDRSRSVFANSRKSFRNSSENFDLRH